MAAAGRRKLTAGAILGLASFGTGAAVWLYAFVLLIVPSEIADIVAGNPVGAQAVHEKARPHSSSEQGTSLGLALLVGALVSIGASPLLGSISDAARTPCGRRIPFILGGVAGSAAAGLGLFHASTFWSYTLWFATMQACVAMAMTAFNGLVYERVPAAQRGAASGIMGGSTAAGNIVGALLGIAYGRTGRVLTYVLVYAVLALGTAVTALFSRDADGLIARVPVVGPALLRWRGSGDAYQPLGEAPRGPSAAMQRLERELGFGAATDVPDDDDGGGGPGGGGEDDDGHGSDGLGVWGEDEETGGTRGRQTAGSGGGAAGPAEPLGAGGRADLDVSMGDRPDAPGAVRSAPRAPGAVLPPQPVSPRRPSLVGGLASFAAPFADHDFRWAFISRLGYQQAVYTVQTYLLYYIRDAVELPPGLEPHAALSLVMLPLLCCALLSPLATGYASDASGGRKRGLLVCAGVVMMGVTSAMALVRSWAALPWLGAAFGGGYGAFNALDFALAMDVLPGGEANAAKELGLWNLALAIPMCLAAPVGGVVLDRVNAAWGHHAGYSVLFGMAALYLLSGVGALLRVRKLR